MMMSINHVIIFSLHFLKLSQSESKIDTKMEGFIVGGSLTSSLENPHAAFLFVSCKKSPNKFEDFGCGGTILNQAIILTAAHCFDTCLPGTNVAIVVGAEDKYKGHNNSASSFTIHSGFDYNTMVNDIALIRTKENINLGLKSKRALLMKYPPKVDLANLAGWGVVEEGKRGKSSMYLKMAKQEIISREVCTRILKQIPNGTFCANGTSKDGTFGYGARGDSGSGLIGDDFVVRGVVSYRNYVLAPSIVVYTDVAHFYDWITSEAEKLYCITVND